ncbi:UDP-N-acetyl-D-mannosamine dehydrogenase [Azospirillum soli]|uniref:UDP-N-acetyl-D-mannosamine dehydrogenase n=1 Tax=Azospirillum soli TaxID=1304799 RepID=UPI001B3C0563|nr:UDP-N-acetyl-D-mannosamine dehydrogenase [Azospirillum soli]MBP2316403.1 UDP-N-acetyl-D-mannosaminuronic acid dehydrogenase [Azospirillum soli]
MDELSRNPSPGGDIETIVVVGLGYVGLPVATVLSSCRKRVVGVDTNPAAVSAINAGRVHIVEPDLDMLVRASVSTGTLRATDRVEEGDAFIVAVPTPFDSDKRPDLSHVHAAADSIAPVLRRGNLVVLESTAPVGATERLSRWLAEHRPDLVFPHQVTGDEVADIHIAHCPERVLPGKVLRELVETDRVIGGITPACAEAAKRLYGTFVKGEIFLTSAPVAELTKLAENAFRDVNIAFANEMALICETLGLNVWEVIRLANRHPRVNILHPGPGVGGHCIAIDPWFIVDSAPQAARLIRTARQINDERPTLIVERVKAIADRFKHPRIAALGLSYKADIDDVRESPAVAIVQALADAVDGTIDVVEPHLSALPRALAERERLSLVPLATALSHADIVILLVDHKAFKGLSRTMLREKIVIDTRGVWDQG